MGEKRGCFKMGCLGCTGVSAVVLIVLAALIGLGLLTGRGEERIEPVDRAHALPGASLPAERDEGAVAESLPPDLIDHEIDVAEPGRIVLDLHRGEFEIVPGPPGEPIRLEGRYDAGRFDLEESYETYGETGWIYRVSFDQRGIGIRPFFQDGPSKNLIRVVIPRDVPVTLEGLVGIGESTLELGGLWILSVDLDIGVGEHTVSFDEPLPIPMGRLRLDTSVGVIQVDRLGNASPRDASVAHSIGETRVDLRGEWRRDAEIDVRCGIGECDVRVPRDVGIDLGRANVTIGESRALADRGPPQPGAPTLTLSVSANIGELNVR